MTATLLDGRVLIDKFEMRERNVASYRPDDMFAVMLNPGGWEGVTRT